MCRLFAGSRGGIGSRSARGRPWFHCVPNAMGVLSAGLVVGSVQADG